MFNPFKKLGIRIKIYFHNLNYKPIVRREMHNEQSLMSIRFLRKFHQIQNNINDLKNDLSPLRRSIIEMKSLHSKLRSVVPTFLNI